MFRTSVCVFATVVAFLVVSSTTAEDSKIFQFNQTINKFTFFTFQVESIKLKLDKTEQVVGDSKKFTENKPVFKDLNETTQEFKLIAGVNTTVTFQFVKTDPKSNSSTYALEQITYDNTNNNANLHLYAKNPELKLTKNVFKPTKQGYKCGDLKITLTNNQNQTGELELLQFEFAAFQGNNTKPALLECRQEPGSSVIPMAVGGGLLVFMAIALVIYIFMRNRSS